MNKKLIAAAVVAGLAAPMAAQADVTVYGIGQLELANIDNGNGSQTTIADSKATRLGVKWSEDLGGGLKALGEFEYASPIEDNTGNALAGRQAYLGLKGGFGTVEIGTVLQPYKYSGGVKYDAFVTTVAEARSGHGGMIKSWFGQGGYFSNAISYQKSFGMAKVWLAYSPEESHPQDALSNAGHAGAKGDLMASLVFNIPNGQVGVAYAKDNNATGTTGPAGEKNTKVFGKYSFGTSTVLAQYEQSKSDVATDYKVYFVG
ncbi:MAG: porin, partial [Gammaproteobacteria bacterium]